MQRGQVVSILQRELALRATGLAAAYLFGSFARGEATDESDVDVGLLFTKRPDSTLEAQPFGLAAELESQLERRVDVVVMNTAPADLVHRILRDGELLLEHDRAARIAFEVKSRNRYFDLLPILRRYRRQAEAR
jgi:predicted nucleotidyltransferase